MFIPKHFKEEDISKLVSFMKEYNFAVIINIKDDKPIATHLPFVIEAENNEVKLISHMAKANEQWNYFDGKSEVLVIFSEPHSYISPKLYEHKQNVPTWNYIAVHAYGVPQIYNHTEETISVLLKQINAFEPSYKSQWDELNNDYREKLLKGIVAFEINVSKLEGKYKLSQNKTETERLNIISHLENVDDKQKTDIAKHMKIK
jgi:transcriptional regulator